MFLRLFVSAIAILCAVRGNASAQVLYGSVVGTAEDPSGAVIPKAKVSLSNKATGATRQSETDGAGRYSLLSVLPGSYELKVTADGFRTLARQGVEVAINTVTRADVKDRKSVV